MPPRFWPLGQNPAGAINAIMIFVEKLNPLLFVLGICCAHLISMWRMTTLLCTFTLD